MEVTHKDDHVTHAVVGGSEKIDYTIADDGFFMQMLSASLYKDQKMAVIRETLCNADDAHKMVNQTKPFEVTLTKEKLVIRDFGPGIPHEKIGPVYATYGGSTKQGDKGQTGGFGLGCKAPFAYTDNFQVTSFCNGTKTVYRMSKSDSEVGGKPSIVKIVSVPTQESGLEVSINILSERDVHLFSSRIVEVLANGEMNAIFNGNQARVLPFSKMEKGYLLSGARPLANTTDFIFVRYGAVIYPVETNESYSVEFRNAERIISRLDQRSHYDEFFLILQAEPGSLSLTPSREGLSITEKTNETLKVLLDNFNNNFAVAYEEETKIIFKKAVEDAVAAKDFSLLLSPSRERSIQQKYVHKNQDDEGNVYIVNSATLAGWDILQRYPGEEDTMFFFDDLKHRLKLLIASEDYPGDRGLLRSFYSSIKSAPHYAAGACAFREFRKRVVAPVFIAMHGAKTMQPKMLSLAMPTYGWAEGRSSHYRNDRVYTRSADHAWNDSLSAISMMQRRVIVLTHKLEDFENNIRTATREEVEKTPGLSKLGKEPDRLFGALVYQVTRGREKVEEARKILGNIKGYLFVDLTAHIEYREPKARVAQTKKKLEGFPTLSGVKVTLNNTPGNQIYDWQLMSTTEGRIDKPIGYVELYGKTHHRGRNHLCGVSTSGQALLLEQFYGDRIAVVMSESQKGVLHKINVFREERWIPAQIQKDLNDPKLLAALPGTLRVLQRWLHKQEVDTDFVRMVLSTPELCDLLKLPKQVHLTGDQSMVMQLLKEFRKDHRSLEESDIVKKIDAIEPPAKVQKFVQGLASNKMLPLIDTAAVRVVFEGSDEEHKAKAIKLIKQILKG